MKISITGSKGFLGSHLVRYLKHKNFGVSELSDKEDLFIPDSLENFVKGSDAVVHLAGLNRDTDYNMFRVNTIGTASLLDAIKNYSPNTKVIFASSYQIYSQNNSYSKSKELAEEIIEFNSKNFGINSIILRISNMFGPGGRPFYNSVIATFINLIENKKPLRINGDGNQRRDFIFVGDVVSAIDKCINYKQSKSLGVFDICSSHLTSINELIQIFEEIKGQKLEVKYSGEKIPSEKEIIISNKRTRIILNWIPKEIKEGLRETLNNEND